MQIAVYSGQELQSFVGHGTFDGREHLVSFVAAHQLQCNSAVYCISCACAVAFSVSVDASLLRLTGDHITDELKERPASRFKS